MKLNYIGNTCEGYTSQDFSKYLHWFKPQKLLGYDIETNVVGSILDRQLITNQFADKYDVWVLQWSYLTEEQQQELLYLLNESHRKLIIHSSTFEGTMMLKHGVILKNVWDTYTCEQILNTGKGAEEGSYNLESVIFKRFGITMDKSQQLLFGDDIMTPEKIRYAGMDVAKSVELYELQLAEMKSFDKSFKQPFHKGLVKTAWWDNEFKLVAGDLEYQGVLIDTNKWTDCYNKSYPAMLEAKAKLDKIVIEEFRDFATEQGWLSDKDRFESIWGSSEKKKEILQLVFPNIEDVTKLGLKEYLRDNDPDFPLVIEKAPKDTIIGGTEIKDYERKLKITGKEWENHYYLYKFDTKFGLLKSLILHKEGDNIYDRLNITFYLNFQEFMLNHEYVIPANTLSLNWASSQQKLTLFKHINPKIENTTALTVEDNLLTHKLFKEYEAYQESAQLCSKFGLDYLKHVQADGKVRTVFNTVLSTGRLSAKEPNLLQLPRNADYRACFVAPEGFKIVDADYDSEELCFIAILSKEPLWLEHLRLGHDIHGTNAEIVLKDIWKNAAEPECAYYHNDYQKCKCKQHKVQRTKIKAINFGLAFGLSAYGLAARQHITEEEANELINTFFNEFKYVKAFLNKCGQFAVANNHIYENGTGRVRFFDKWKTAKRVNHYGEYEYANPEEMRGVMRAGMNFPIQALGSSVIKVAMVLIRRWINNSNLREHIQFMLPYHDQILLYARVGYEDLAKERLEFFMKLAGKLLLKNDLLRATANVSDYWIKD